MKKDISERDDIERLVNTFYEKVKKDQVIGYIFNDIAQVDWEHHLPIMYNFWETVLLGSYKYAGNPITAHVQLDQKVQLTTIHFAQWIKIFHSTIDELFEGEKATMAKERAESIAAIMQAKIYSSRS